MSKGLEVIDKGFCGYAFIERGDWVRLVAKRDRFGLLEYLYCEAYLGNGGCWVLRRCRFGQQPVGKVVLGRPEQTEQFI